MSAVLLVVMGGFGLLIGSFLNVVVYRVPAGLSFVRPGSACPGCGEHIQARVNVPLLSWLALRGRCRHCRMPIPVRYPAIEALTGLAFAAAAVPFLPALEQAQDVPQLFAAALELAAFLYLAAISIALAAIDLDHSRLPDAIVLPAYGVGVVLLGGADLLRGDLTPAILALVGAAASALFYFALAIAKPGGMGLGDVKLAGVLGLFLGHLGLAPLLVGTAAAFFGGGLFGIALIALRRSNRRTAIPFGPWMLAGAWLGIFFGGPIADWYLSLVGLR